MSRCNIIQGKRAIFRFDGTWVIAVVVVRWCRGWSWFVLVSVPGLRELWSPSALHHPAFNTCPRPHLSPPVRWVPRPSGNNQGPKANEGLGMRRFRYL